MQELAQVLFSKFVKCNWILKFQAIIYASISSAFDIHNIKILSRVNHEEVDAFVTPPNDIIGTLKSTWIYNVLTLI